MEDLFDRVIGTVYLPRARNRVEKTLVKTLFRWIYQVRKGEEEGMIGI